MQHASKFLIECQNMHTLRTIIILCWSVVALQAYGIGADYGYDDQVYVDQSYNVGYYPDAPIESICTFDGIRYKYFEKQCIFDAYNAHMRQLGQPVLIRVDPYLCDRLQPSYQPNYPAYTTTTERSYISTSYNTENKAYNETYDNATAVYPKTTDYNVTTAASDYNATVSYASYTNYTVAPTTPTPTTTEHDLTNSTPDPTPTGTIPTTAVPTTTVPTTTVPTTTTASTIAETAVLIISLPNGSNVKCILNSAGAVPENVNAKCVFASSAYEIQNCLTELSKLSAGTYSSAYSYNLAPIAQYNSYSNENSYKASALDYARY